MTRTWWWCWSGRTVWVWICWMFCIHHQHHFFIHRWGGFTWMIIDGRNNLIWFTSSSHFHVFTLLLSTSNWPVKRTPWQSTVMLNLREYGVSRPVIGQFNLFSLLIGWLANTGTGEGWQLSIGRAEAGHWPIRMPDGISSTNQKRGNGWIDVWSRRQEGCDILAADVGQYVHSPGQEVSAWNPQLKFTRKL